jgi:dTDP-4-dehydrorhamnose reductase
LEHVIADPLAKRLLITGAGGQLGRALTEVWGLTVESEPDLVLHTSAFTDVDGAEADENGARLVNVDRTREVVALGAPVVYFSTDYVFDGRKGEPYVESDQPNPLSVYGRTKLEGERELRDGWIVRSSWLFAPWGKNFVLTMLALGREREEVSVVDDQRGCPTYVGHLAEATLGLVTLPYGTYHVAADDDCTWAEFAEAIFEEAGIECRVERTTTAELGRPAPRPANSVLRSEKPETPRLPHWRQGLRDCLSRLSA